MKQVVIITDPFTDETPEQEAQHIMDELENNGLGCDKVISGEGAYVLEEHPNTDLVVIDYGGISLGGAYDTAVSNVRYVCQWAEDHPNSVLIIWTEFTRSMYQDELGHTFGHLRNILFRYNDYHENPDWATEARLWLGANL